MSDFLGIDLVAGLDQGKTVSEINATISRITDDPKLNKVDLKININDDAVRAIREINSQIKEMGTTVDKLNAKLKNLGVSRGSDKNLEKQVDQIKQNEQATSKAGKTATDVARQQREAQNLLNKTLAEGNTLKKESYKLDENKRRVGVTREYGDRDGISTKSFNYKLDGDKETLISGKEIENIDRANKTVEKHHREHNKNLQSISAEREKISKLLRNAETMHGADSKVIGDFRKQMQGSDLKHWQSLTKGVEGYTDSLKTMSDAERIRLAQQKAAFNVDKLGRAVHGTISPEHQRALDNYIANMMRLDTNIPGWQQKLSRYGAEFSNLRDQVIHADQGFARFSKQMASAMLRVPIYAATISAMYAPMRMFQDALQQTIEIDSQLTVLDRVSNGTIEMNTALEDSIDIANRLGNVVSEVNDVLINFARQGYRGDDLTAISEVATVMSNVSDLGAEDAASSLTAAMKAFNIEAKDSIEIVDSLNEVDNNYSITTQQLAQTIQKSAGVANTFGKLNAA